MASGDLICLESRRRAGVPDVTLVRALAVPVPARLAESVVRSVDLRCASRRRLLAWCASMAAACTLGGAIAWMGRSDPLGLACIDFVVDEEANAILAASPPDGRALAQAAALLGIDLPPQLGNVRHVGDCLFQGTRVHHLIATTPQGKITILLMPERAVAAVRTAAARGLHAAVVPARSGSIVLIGHSARALARARHMVLRSPAETA